MRLEGVVDGPVEERGLAGGEVGTDRWRGEVAWWWRQMLRFPTGLAAGGEVTKIQTALQLVLESEDVPFVVEG